jgi:hypothetical protein
MSRYEDCPDDWFAILHRGWKLQCCDCGLVHKIDARIKGKRIELRIKRDARATAAVRKGKRLNGVG